MLLSQEICFCHKKYAFVRNMLLSNMLLSQPWWLQTAHRKSIQNSCPWCAHPFSFPALIIAVIMPVKSLFDISWWASGCIIKAVQFVTRNVQNYNLKILYQLLVYKQEFSYRQSFFFKNLDSIVLFQILS